MHQSNNTCDGCGVTLTGIAYELRTAGGGRSARCLRCGLSYGPLIRRSVVVALLVGTLLVAINQGNVIISGGFSASLYWKIPLTYCVPFAVATTGALLNARAPGKEWLHDRYG
jgi:hypothetical protein